MRSVFVVQSSTWLFLVGVAISLSSIAAPASYKAQPVIVPHPSRIHTETKAERTLSVLAPERALAGLAPDVSREHQVRIAPSDDSEQLAALDPMPDTEAQPHAALEVDPVGPTSLAKEVPADELSDAKRYLVRTAVIGGTMGRQGPNVAIGRLHPEFAERLAAAIQAARSDTSCRSRSGKRDSESSDAGPCLTEAAVMSAYRPPAFGVGGFADKFNSLHSYGLAVDMTGIGSPGSEAAKRWHEIAAEHGIVCPYGPYNRAEWNHCQATPVKMVREGAPLRKTITAAGPIDNWLMWLTANSLIIGRDGALGAAAVRELARETGSDDDEASSRPRKRHRHVHVADD